MGVLHTDEQSVELIKKKRMRADDFVMIKCIGRGAFGEVQLVCTADSCCSDVCTGTTREIHVNHVAELMMISSDVLDEDEDVAYCLIDVVVQFGPDLVLFGFMWFVHMFGNVSLLLT